MIAQAFAIDSGLGPTNNAYVDKRAAISRKACQLPPGNSGSSFHGYERVSGRRPSLTCLPMWLINPESALFTRAFDDLVVTAGVHAAEYAGIAAALRELGFRSLDPGSLSGRVICEVPILDHAGRSPRVLFTSVLWTAKNPNRVFPGNPHGTASEQICRLGTSNVMSQGDSLRSITTRGGDLIEALVPFTIFFRTGDKRVDEASLEMARDLRYSFSGVQRDAWANVLRGITRGHSVHPPTEKPADRVSGRPEDVIARHT